MDRTLTVRIDDELDQQLEEAARRLRVSKGALVREALRARLTVRKPNAYDLLKPVVGIVKGGPRDVSVSKAYLTGFGARRRR